MVAALALVASALTFLAGAAPASAATVTRAFVTNLNSGTVSVIDPATNTVVATIGVGDGPFGVAVNPAGTRAYVTNLSSGTVSVIDTATNTVVATVAVGDGPFGVAVNPAGTRAFVTNQGSGTVSVIDTATNTVVATIGVGAGPFGVAVAAVPVDTTPPACALTAMRAGPPTQIDVTVQDPASGLASVVVTQSDNANTVVPPFAVGSTAPVVVTATKITQGQPAHVALQVTDVAGNVTNCDPVLGGKPVTPPTPGGTPSQSQSTFQTVPTSSNFGGTGGTGGTLARTGAEDTLALAVGGAALAGALVVRRGLRRRSPA